MKHWKNGKKYESLYIYHGLQWFFKVTLKMAKLSKINKMVKIDKMAESQKSYKKVMN